MAMIAEVRLIFSTRANGNRKNSNSHVNGRPNTTRRWNSSERTRSGRGAGKKDRFMGSVPEQDGAGGFPGDIHPVAPGGPLASAFHVGHGGLYPFPAGQFHIVGGNVPQIRDVIDDATTPVGVAFWFVGGQVDFLRAQ